MRVVLDTNVIVSAVVFGGRPASALNAMRRPDFVLLATEGIFEEIRSVLTRKFPLTEESIGTTLRQLRSFAERVDPGLPITACRNPDDNRILEAAIAGKADCIVSGDADLLSMHSFEDIEIISVAEFLKRIGD